MTRHATAQAEQQGLVAGIRLMYERIDAQDPAGAFELFSDHAVYRRPGYPPMRGKAAIRRFYEQERVIREGAHTLVRCVVENGIVAVQSRFEGVLKDGTETELESAEFFTVDDDGLFNERTTFFFAPLV